MRAPLSTPVSPTCDPAGMHDLAPGPALAGPACGTTYTRSSKAASAPCPSHGLAWAIGDLRAGNTMLVRALLGGIDPVECRADYTAERVHTFWRHKITATNPLLLEDRYLDRPNAQRARPAGDGCCPVGSVSSTGSSPT